MRSDHFLMLILLFLLHACGKPKATVFEDKRLEQEEVVKICLLGDLGRDAQQQKDIAKSLERERCHRIFFLGDPVYPKGISSADDPELENRSLSYYRPLLESDPDLVIPLLLGNHDHKGDPSAWKDVSSKYPQFFFPHYYYFIDYGGLCFVALDTSFYYYTEKVAEAADQAKWLTQMQSRINECDVKIAFSHHPFKGGDHAGSKDWNGAPQPLKGFLDTYIIGRMDMHITGHVHILADDGKDEGTRMLISGTGGEILGGGQPGYVILTWERMNPKRIGYSFRRIDTDVTVVSEDIQQQEKPRPEDVESEYVINKSRVEDPFVIKFFKKLFNQDEQ